MIIKFLDNTKAEASELGLHPFPTLTHTHTHTQPILSWY